ncbi:hypothetical protein THAOC_26077, partial [Thalassiosira oceanica]
MQFHSNIVVGSCSSYPEQRASAPREYRLKQGRDAEPSDGHHYLLPAGLARRHTAYARRIIVGDNRAHESPKHQKRKRGHYSALLCCVAALFCCAAALLRFSAGGFSCLGAGGAVHQSSQWQWGATLIARPSGHYLPIGPATADATAAHQPTNRSQYVSGKWTVSMYSRSSRRSHRR